MNHPHPYGEDHDEPTVMGFEVPRSPDASYNNVYPGHLDEGREPPMVPPHLHHTLLNHPATRDESTSLPLPQNAVLNHLYIENGEVPSRGKYTASSAVENVYFFPATSSRKIWYQKVSDVPISNSG
ncbi:hypothetical protein MTR67_026018 [Solanum verrucosum]|uniref:Association with the SNF1 complex (ASC) domain-containing protein n=1 Tax=Solanum verrucosum TaxID=315347 RepID=A0AAF0TZL3_SOLVR|nr:hypothetical protein MTR67_026018 [Solanum verrucosum]